MSNAPVKCAYCGCPEHSGCTQTPITQATARLLWEERGPQFRVTDHECEYIRAVQLAMNAPTYAQAFLLIRDGLTHYRVP